MAVPEPSSAYGLWPRVKATTYWPEPDEVAMAALAEAWRTSGERFAEAARHDLQPVQAMWPDAAGRAFGTRATTLTSAAAVSRDMAMYADRTARFAAEVTGVKNGIRALIEANLERYATATALPAGVGDTR